MKKAIVSTVAALGLVFATAATAAQVELITNGGFETGDFTGWNAQIEAGSNGTVEVTSNSTAPIGGQTVPAPSEGQFHALTGQSGPGAYAVSQLITLADVYSSLILTFDLFASTNANFVDAGNLDHTGGPNQHVRVDLLVAGSDGFDVGNVIASILVPFIDGQFPGAYTSYSFDLLPLLGNATSFVLRFGQVDNQGHFSMGIDNVSLLAENSEVPLPAALPFMMTGLAAFGATRRRKKTQV